jgi:polar amino acid transport system permease protein
MDFEPIVRNLPFLLSGLAVTLAVGSISLALALVLGSFLALLRLSSIRPLRFLATLYVDFIRSTPLYIQLVWLYFVLTIVTGISLNLFTTATVGLGAYSAAYFAEVIRAGVLAVPAGQSEAAIAQGMSVWQRARRIVLPQAIRLMLPPATSTLVNHIKDTSLVSVIGLADLMYQSYSLSAMTFRPFEVLIVAALIYFAICYPPTLLANRLYRSGANATSSSRAAP